MDEPNPHPVKYSTKAGIALVLVIFPPVLSVAVWPWLKNSPEMGVIFFALPILGGLGAGAILSRLNSWPLGPRIVLFVVLSAVCGIVSLILSVVGCVMMNPIRS